MNKKYFNKKNLELKKYFSRLCISALVISLCLFAFICNGCSSDRQASVSFYAMDTIMQITCYGKDAQAAVDAAQAEIIRLDELLSIGNENSEVSLINKNGGGVLGTDVSELTDYALMLYQLTGGAYDMTILPVMELWGFTTGEYAVPDEDELTNVLSLCDSSRVSVEKLNEESVDISEASKKTDYKLELSSGQGIDFGGLAKGYATDRLVQIFDSYNVKSAYFSLGGNVYCYHKKTDGSDWNIAIENPLWTADYLGAVRVHDKAVVTSGGYERYFEQDGKRYHHIIDPATGYPADSGLISVTVVSGDGTLADGLSTACYVLGFDESMKLWEKYGGGGSFDGKEIAPFDLIMMADDDDVYVTQGIVQNFSSGYDVHIVEKEDKK